MFYTGVTNAPRLGAGYVRPADFIVPHSILPVVGGDSMDTMRIGRIAMI